MWDTMLGQLIRNQNESQDYNNVCVILAYLVKKNGGEIRIPRDELRKAESTEDVKLQLNIKQIDDDIIVTVITTIQATRIKDVKLLEGGDDYDNYNDAYDGDPDPDAGS